MSKLDPEKFLNDAIKEGDGDVVITRENAELLKARLRNYRARISDCHVKYHRDIDPVSRKVKEHEQMIDAAVQRLDPEGHGFSGLTHNEVVEVGVLIEAVNKRRGKVVANRLLYGNQPSQVLVDEQLSVLRQAVKEVDKVKKIWYDRLDRLRAAK